MTLRTRTGIDPAALPYTVIFIRDQAGEDGRLRGVTGHSLPAEFAELSGAAARRCEVVDA